MLPKESMKSSHKLLASIRTLPDSPGVYLFYGPADELLYVGKSKRVRSRVRSHFHTPEEIRLRRSIRRIEVRETAGELGALLLESQLIKELRPRYNVMSRQRRRIIVARRVDTPGGYAGIRLEAVDRIDPAELPIVAIFKHKTQARDYLADAARAHRLCPKLLRLETSRGPCFSYHLGHCDGACCGEEDVGAYNKRFERAFEARRVKAWPYAGAVVIKEVADARGLEEHFYIDNWCLLGGRRHANDGSPEFVMGSHRFDYDSYKILYSYISDDRNGLALGVVSRGELLRLVGPPGKNV